MAKDDTDTKEEAKKGGKGKLIIMVIPLVILIAAAAWYFFLRPKDDGAPKALPAPTAGVPIAVDPITINLAEGHFLKLGMALQPIAGLKEAPSGSKALDIAIAQFSGKSIDDISSDDGRREAKDELVARVKLAYLPEGSEETTAAATTASNSDESSSNSESSSDKSTSGEDTTDQDEGLTGEQAIKKAKELTVQPEIYDVYLTEFVYQ